MRRISTSQMAVIGAAVVSTVLLCIVHTWPSHGKISMPPPMMNSAQGLSIDVVVNSEKAKLKPEILNSVNFIEASLSSERDANKRRQAYDSLISLLSTSRSYILSAWYAEEKANKTSGSSADWEAAGDRFTNAAQFVTDEKEIPAIFQSAVNCFNKSLTLDPKNLDAKVGLGLCAVNDTEHPEQGIKMILDVIAEDSNNLNAQLALGDLSIRRGAPDKAIVRYSNALRIQPAMIDLYVRLADLYKETGDTASAISNLEMYVQHSNDPVMKNDVENDIRSLRESLGKKK
ncbi:MAG: tetratricopeptide repeat protein [Bacteroidetes bacterium]|nr:tetratricopeptide repeat protein [Bacteroidota bacterium]